MKKSKLFAVLFTAALCATTFFTSCGNQNDTFEINATNVIGNTDRIATVRAKDHNGVLLGEAQFRNNGFTLFLTGSLSNSVLTSVSEAFPNKTISRRNARGTSIGYFIAFDNEGNEIGLVILSGDRHQGFGDYLYSVSWLYVNRNVSIKGGSKQGDFYIETDYNLKTGWNIIYEDGSFNEPTGTRIFKFTTQKPSGMDFEWQFVEK